MPITSRLLPKMARAAQTEELKQAFQRHRDETEQQEAAERLDDALLGTDGPITVGSGGRSPIFQSVSSQIEGDLRNARSAPAARRDRACARGTG